MEGCPWKDLFPTSSSDAISTRTLHCLDAGAWSHLTSGKAEITVQLSAQEKERWWADERPATYIVRFHPYNDLSKLKVCTLSSWQQRMDIDDKYVYTVHWSSPSHLFLHGSRKYFLIVAAYFLFYFFTEPRYHDILSSQINTLGGCYQSIGIRIWH